MAAIKALEQSPHKVKVHVLDGEERHDAADGWSLAEKVRTHLAENPTRYDVIHFAGHALFATSKAKKPPAGKGKKTQANRFRTSADTWYFQANPRRRSRLLRWQDGSGIRA